MIEVIVLCYWYFVEIKIKIRHPEHPRHLDNVLRYIVLLLCNTYLPGDFESLINAWVQQKLFRPMFRDELSKKYHKNKSFA